MKQYLLALSAFNAQTAFIDDGVFCNSIDSYNQALEAKGYDDFKKLNNQCFPIFEHHEIIVDEVSDQGFTVFHTPNNPTKFYISSSWIKEKQ